MSLAAAVVRRWRWIAASTGLALSLAVGPWAEGAATANPWQTDAAAWEQAANAVAQLSARQRTILDQLLQTDLHLRNAQTTVQRLDRQIAQAQAELTSTQRQVAAIDARRQAAAQQAATLLRIVQYLGPGSFLGVLLSAHSWTGFIHRAGAVAATLSLMHQQLERLRTVHGQLEAALAHRQAVAAALAGEQAQWVKTAATLASDQRALEQELAALGSEQRFYQNQLAAVQAAWASLMIPALQALQSHLNEALQQGSSDFPVQIGTTAQGTLSATIVDADFNQWLAATPGLNGIAVHFGNASDSISFTGRGVTLQGRFVVLNATALMFRMDQIDFFGLVVPPSLLGPAAPARLVWNLAPVLSGLQLRSVSTTEGALTMTFSPEATSGGTVG